jgi:hypothetical protein
MGPLRKDERLPRRRIPRVNYERQGSPPLSRLLISCYGNECPQDRGASSTKAHCKKKDNTVLEGTRVRPNSRSQEMNDTARIADCILL